MNQPSDSFFYQQHISDIDLSLIIDILYELS